MCVFLTYISGGLTGPVQFLITPQWSEQISAPLLVNVCGEFCQVRQYSAFKMNFEKSVTNSGNECIIFENFKYRRYRNLSSGNISWRCTNKKCSASLETEATGSTIQIAHNQHTHNELSPHQMQKDCIRNACKRKAEESLCERPSKIVRSTLACSTSDSLNHNNISVIKQAMYEQRRKHLPKKPRSQEEALLQLQTSTVTTTKGEKFVYRDGDIAFITCESNLAYLVSNADIILADGTFYTCPKYFYQLYVIHVYKNDQYLQLVFCFLPHKDTPTYTRMWLGLQKMCQGKLQPRTILLDFEKAAIDAARNVFGTVKIQCCRFHLGQNWFKKIVEVGLKTEYSTNASEISSWLKLFFWIVLLEP